MFSGSVGLSGDVSDASEYHQDGSDDSDVHSIGCSYGGCRKSLVSSGIGQVGHVQSHEDDGYDGEEQCDYPEDLVDRFAPTAGHWEDGGDEADDSANQGDERYITVRCEFKVRQVQGQVLAKDGCAYQSLVGVQVPSAERVGARLRPNGHLYGSPLEEHADDHQNRTENPQDSDDVDFSFHVCHVHHMQSSYDCMRSLSLIV